MPLAAQVVDHGQQVTQAGSTPVPVQIVGGIPTTPPSQIHPVLWSFLLDYIVPISTLVGAVAAGAAAYYGWRTLQGIKQQVALAQEQIGVANAQTRLAQGALDLATKEFDATIETLKITRTQAVKFDAKDALTPDLMVIASKEDVDTNRIVVEAYEPDFEFELPFVLYNKGSKTATNITVEFTFPAELRLVNPNKRFEKAKPFFGKAFRWEPERLANPLIPDDEISLRTMYAEAKPGEYQIHWFAKYSEGQSPPKQPDSELQPSATKTLVVVEVESPSARRMREWKEIENDPIKLAEFEASMAPYTESLAKLFEHFKNSQGNSAEPGNDDDATHQKEPPKN